MTGQDERDWTAGAFLFSGRPDPVWTVAHDTAEQLVERWQRLPPAGEIPPPKPVLGSRGCWLRRPDGWRLVARDGFVVGEQENGKAGRSAAREDSGRAFERALLATAPPGVLPRELRP